MAAYGVARGGVRPGDRVLVAGAGPIGALAALCAARLARAPSMCRSRMRPSRASRGGVERSSSSTRRPWTPEFLRERTDGLGVDVAIECPGTRRLRQTPSSTPSPRDGRQTGPSGRRAVDPMLWALNDLTIVGRWCYGVNDLTGSPRRSRPAVAGRTGHHEHHLARRRATGLPCSPQAVRTR